MDALPEPLKPPGSRREGWPWSFSPSAGSAAVEGPPEPPKPAELPQSPGGWPRISLVVTSYNQGDFLEETLRAILLQGYPELQLLVVDGGSGDESVDILRYYDRWIDAWSSEPDSGQSDAINKGFARASGDIVTFIASDDVYEPGTLFDVAQKWSECPGCGAIVGAFQFLDETSSRDPQVYPPRLPSPGPHDLALLDTSLWRLHQVSTFYSRDALDEVGRRVREDLDYTMDRELLYRVCRRFPTVLSERTYAAFRRHSTSKSTTQILPMMREMADLHLMDVPEDEPDSLRRRRRALWRERMARGYVKLSRSGASWWRRIGALLQAPLVEPHLLAQRGYHLSWLENLGLLNRLRRLRVRPQ